VEVIFILSFLIGTFSSIAIYRNATKDPIIIPLLSNRFYIDNFYNWCVNHLQQGLAHVVAFVDRWIIDGFFVRGIALVFWSIGFTFRFLQVGNLQAYAIFLGVGVIGMIFLLLRIH
jgi:NADH:ubiquinone oxidoreductase subunit 5 (subunit L)/multisubunit Na+/H+ antiporter MnhA subunit